MSGSFDAAAEVQNFSEVMSFSGQAPRAGSMYLFVQPEAVSAHLYKNF